MRTSIQPGLLVLHGNRLEDLRELVVDWTSRHPLDPLEEAIFLVQSNGIAEWLKIALAQDTGICAATRVELPARFLWRAYRQVLGREAVPAQSPLDKGPLAWRLQGLLPDLIEQPEFAPLAHFLADRDPRRCHQLAEKIADLFDQYQVYRADWLEDWAAGRDVLRKPASDPVTLKADELWQAALWRAVLDDIAQELRDTGRAQIHRRFLAHLAQNPPRHALPRRVVVFGISALPMQTLEALAAIAGHTQVILAVPNPCQFHWADLIDGRDLLRQERRRQKNKGGDLAAVPLEEMHAFGNPLLASWGRMGRDFVRLLDEFDDAETARARFDISRIDLFDSGAGESLLSQVQAAIRDLDPLPAAPQAVASDDRSIVFQIAHSAQREVEILHDHLLQLFASSNLKPRDVVVMAPDIATFAPAIRAVFGQYPHTDPRHIPFGISDQAAKAVNPLLGAIEWLLGLPTARCTASEIADLIDVPALARRFGLSEADLPRVQQWIAGAGVRWGLSGEHRLHLGLAACGEQNSWLFGIRRMLLGFASDAPFAGIEPYDEVGGLDAALAGSLAALVGRLISWQQTLRTPATPEEWLSRARDVLADFFDARDEADRLTIAQLQSALHGWIETCEIAAYAEPVALEVFAPAWLNLVDEPSVNQRFLAGGVTFCTLMPMRAIPFGAVCLIGMNDGDYPRQMSRTDFDLLARPGMYRPGDRSRRDDDRYLMLEALLAARRQLYISWVGRSVRDNSHQPPSVLVSQLRDYLAAGWALEQGKDKKEDEGKEQNLLKSLTIEHPLQPFSRSYFEGGKLVSYAREWSDAHAQNLSTATTLPDWQPGQEALTLADLTEFCKSPVRAFFRKRLDVVFADADESLADDETFALDGLTEYLLVKDVLAGLASSDTDLDTALTCYTERLSRAGALPIGELGRRAAKQLAAEVAPLWTQWQRLRESHPQRCDAQAVHFVHDGIALADWLDGLYADDDTRVWFRLEPGRLCDSKQNPRADKLLEAWLRQLAAAACGANIGGILVGRDATLHLPLPERAAETLALVLQTWRAGMNAPLPLALKTGVAEVQQLNPQDVYEGGFNTEGEVSCDAALSRVYPDFEALTADGRFAELAHDLYGALCDWIRAIEVITHTEEQP